MSPVAVHQAGSCMAGHRKQLLSYTRDNLEQFPLTVCTRPLGELFLCRVSQVTWWPMTASEDGLRTRLLQAKGAGEGGYRSRTGRWPQDAGQDEAALDRGGERVARTCHSRAARDHLPTLRRTLQRQMCWDWSDSLLDVRSVSESLGVKHWK